MIFYIKKPFKILQERMKFFKSRNFGKQPDSKLQVILTVFYSNFAYFEKIVQEIYELGNYIYESILKFY